MPGVVREGTALAKDQQTPQQHPDEKLFATIVENLPHMVFVKDASELRFVRFNRAGEELLGFPRESMIGKNDYDFFPAPEADFFTAKDREVLAGGRLVDIPEEPVHTRDRGVRILHTKKIPILDDSGRPLYLLGISEDITERKAAQTELERLNSALRLQSSDLRGLLDEVRAFSYAVSHDLRSPLRSIDGFCHYLLEEIAPGLNDKGRDALLRVRAAAQRMGRLIDGVLTLARLSHTELHRQRVDLSALAQHLAPTVQSTHQSEDVDFRVQSGMVVSGDPALLATLLRQLLDNAVKFSARCREPQIEVGRTAIGQETVFFVKDNGIGFNPSYAGHLFRTFERMENAEDYEGSGVGLATVDRIVRRHGGRVWAEGAPERGATLYFTLPAAD